MAAHFDVRTAQVIEFGVGLEDRRGERYVLVPIDEKIQGALREMVEKTRSELNKANETPTLYEPSEKHGGKENLRLPLNHELAANIRLIHEAENMRKEPRALSDPNAVFCYFTRMTDAKGNRLTAIRVATGFMRVLKNRSHFIQMLNDTLKLVDEDIFKLDRDFDLLVDGDEVQILRHAGFESVGKLEDEIKKAVPKNVKEISHDLTFVDFAAIEEYAKMHSRAARSLASIRDQRLKKINQHKLRRACTQFNVQTRTAQGKLVIEPGSIMDFLYLLDRRLYRIELTDAAESYLAASRKPR
jgi:hypothetical protein